MKNLPPPTPHKVCAILLVTLVFNFVFSSTNLAQSCTNSPICPNVSERMIFSNSLLDWTETQNVLCSGEKITIKTAFSTTITIGTTANFYANYNFRSDGGRIGQLTTGDYVYGSTNRFNFIGDDLISLANPVSSAPRLTGFHNFDNNISTVFGTYKDDYTTSDPVNPTIFWENDDSVNSRLRFLNRITGNATNELGTILESGNWGIGNTNPNSKLEVKGGLFITDLSSTSITAPTGFIYSNGPILMGSESFISSVPNNVFIATQSGTRAAIGLADPYGFLHVHSPTSGSFSGLDDFKLTDQATGNTGTDGFSLNINGSNVDIVNYENGDLRFSTNGTNVRMTIDQTGNIIIGGSTAYQVLTVNGHAAKNSGGTSWGTFSDKRLKKDIKKFEGGLEEVIKINPIWFRYNGILGTNSEKIEVGVVAQELLEVSPYMVEEYYDSTFGIFLGVNNGAMTYILINSVKQLNQQNIELLNKIEVLQNQLKEIIKSESIPIKDIVAEYPTIGQNKPNLFDSKTTISYFIPQYIKEAYIRVFDSNNLTLKIYKIENSGNGEVVFECNSCFDKTILYYSLIINEKIIDIKKMVQN